jgi:hypothetical protein
VLLYAHLPSSLAPTDLMRMCDTAMEQVAQASFGGGGGAAVEEVEVEVGEVGAVAEEEAEGEAMTAREQH